ncbi:hypothetical protein [Serinicoccus kebangsaanensis]|uniref:hypothetical protein n=1 Tax=Serinicoccus kebangsaanensis TaxID=2602069 RepID=UPI00124C285F|nr:hypothetical protein [Serinicoccus kebangsaanensis]
MTAATVRALEDLLRRVLRAPDHGIEPRRQSVAVRGRVEARRWRAGAVLVAAVVVLAALVLIGWYVRWLGSG